MKLTGFDAAKHQPTQEKLGALPPGDYTVEITDSQQKTTKAGNGSYLELVLRVVEGSYERRQLWVRLNLDNPNPQAVKLAQAELSAICRAVGVLTPDDSSNLHGRPMVVTVPALGSAGMRNEVRAYHPAVAASGADESAF
jgi:rhamnose utilization protein RhaD (predicted bifunctional aldolase and dehydrogenase)